MFAVIVMAAASIEPLIALGALVIVLMLPLPVNWLLAVFITASIVSTGQGLDVGPFNVLPGQILIVPLAIRVFVIGRLARRPPWGWPEVCLGVWIGLSFLSSLLNAADVGQSVISAGQLTAGAVTYLTISAAMDTRAALIWITRLVLWTSFVSAAIGVAAVLGYVLGVHVLDLFLASGGFGQAGLTSLPKGVIVENNVFGSFSAAGAISFFVLLRERNAAFSRRTAAVGFWLCLTATVLSATRGAWIALAVAFAAYAIVRSVHPRPGRVAFGSALLPTLVALLALASIWYLSQTPSAPRGASSGSSPIIESAGGLLDFETGTGKTRVTGWTEALEDVRTSPLIGLGTNSFSQRHVSGEPPLTQPATLGSIYLRTLYDTGLIGLLLFCSFLLGALWPPRAVRYSHGDLAPISRAFLFGFLVFAVAFIATDAIFQIWPWVVLGCAKGASGLALHQARGGT